MGKTSSAVKNRYNAKVYDQLPIRVPKGCASLVKCAAESAGESVNAFICKAVLCRMGLDAWPTPKGNSQEHGGPGEPL